MVSAVSMGLRRDVTRLGERLRNPSVVSDTWNLISDLLEFRGRLRAGIGELIYQLASTVEDVERINVVPGYALDLSQALLVRNAATNLAFLFRGHARRIAATPLGRISFAGQDTEGTPSAECAIASGQRAAREALKHV